MLDMLIIEVLGRDTGIAPQPLIVAIQVFGLLPGGLFGRLLYLIGLENPKLIVHQNREHRHIDIALEIFAEPHRRKPRESVFEVVEFEFGGGHLLVFQFAAGF